MVSTLEIIGIAFIAALVFGTGWFIAEYADEWMTERKTKRKQTEKLEENRKMARTCDLPGCGRPLPEEPKGLGTFFTKKKAKMAALFKEEWCERCEEDARWAVREWRKNK